MRTSLVLTGKIMVDNLREAYEKFIAPQGVPEEDVALITDGGPENDCEAVDDYVSGEKVSLKQLIAGQDISFSNSMVEAVNKVLKYRYLFHRDFSNYEDLREYLVEAVPNYNSVKPHSALKGHTPEQILKGESLDFSGLKAQMEQARQKRVEVNRKASCGVCT